METRRRDACARLVRTAPAKIGLADVVRSARNLSGKPVVCQADCQAAGRLARCEPIDRDESIPSRTAALHSRDILWLRFYDVARTTRHRDVVETRRSSGTFAPGCRETDGP